MEPKSSKSKVSKVNKTELVSNWPVWSNAKSYWPFTTKNNTFLASLDLERLWT